MGDDVLGTFAIAYRALLVAHRPRAFSAEERLWLERTNARLAAALTLAQSHSNRWEKHRNAAQIRALLAKLNTASSKIGAATPKAAADHSGW